MNGDLWMEGTPRKKRRPLSFLNFTIEDIAHSSNVMRQQCFLFSLQS